MNAGGTVAWERSAEERIGRCVYVEPPLASRLSLGVVEGEAEDGNICLRIEAIAVERAFEFSDSMSSFRLSRVNYAQLQ